MANQFFVPFNFNPVATAQTSSPYTVPAGKYAIAKIMLQASVYLNDETGIVTLSGGAGITSGNESANFEIVIKAGDVLAATETAANKTVTLTSAATTTAFAKSIASVTVDTGSGASIVGYVEAVGSCMVDGNAGTSDTIDFDGSAGVYWHIQEYTIIS